MSVILTSTPAPTPTPGLEFVHEQIESLAKRFSNGDRGLVAARRTPALSMEPAAIIGRRVADLLRGIWWHGPRDWQPNASALTALSPLLRDSGLSGLIWARLPVALRATRTGRDFRSAALADAGAAARIDAVLSRVLEVLANRGIEPVVLKGWAVARDYPDPAGRTYCDIDLAVPPEQAERAQAVLASLDLPAGLVDLHIGIADLPRRDWSAAFARTKRVPCGNTSARVLCPEDQIRLLTNHFVRHSCRRALGLCDLAVLLEAAGQDLDWELCLGGSHGLKRWILAVAGLAERLLGAQLPDAIAERPGTQPAKWLENMVLWQWGGGDVEEPWWSGGGVRGLKSRVAYRRFWNPAVWSQRLGLPPVRFLPMLWAAALCGRAIQPFARITRGLARLRDPNPVFHAHEAWRF
jgi:Uncharacterised nucleotidyltransferase